MNSYKKLMDNSMVFAIGTMGSKMLNVILLPLYTYYLTTEEYGNADIIITTATMLLPIISFSMYDAALRFALNKSLSKKIVISNAVICATFGVIISSLLVPILSTLEVYSDLTIYLFLIMSVQIYERIFAQFARGIGKVKSFAINGILLTSSTALFNLLFLVLMDKGIEGYLLSIICANLVSLVYLSVSVNSIKNIKLKYFDIDLIKNMLVYSIPLIPNSIMWWLINASSRFFIFSFVGLSANGLFAVASKIPSLLGIVAEIFSQAWQLSAVEEYERENETNFYSQVFKYYLIILMTGVMIILVTIKPLVSYIFAAEYYESWKIIPFLLLGVLFSSLSGFLGAFYIASKETKGVFKTSVYGGIISLVLNLILIPNFGLIGAAISSMCSFFCMFILRYKDSQKYVSITINKKTFCVSFGLIILQIISLYLNLGTAKELVIGLIFIIIIFATNKDILYFLKFIFYSMRMKIKR